jgi:hypothetical protein
LEDGGESDVALTQRLRNTTGGKPLAVVTDEDAKGLGFTADRNIDLGCARVLPGVAQKLADDGEAKDASLTEVVVVDLKRDLHPAVLGDGLGERLERGRQPELVERMGMELKGQLAQRLERVAEGFRG